MEIDFDQIELAVVVNLATLRQVLRRLCIDGKRWWIASDPADAARTLSITIGHGDSRCTDRLNTLFFNVPVLGSSVPGSQTDSLVLLFDPSTSIAAEAGYYIEDGRVVQDSLEDFLCFFRPIHRALITRLQEESQSQKGES